MRLSSGRCVSIARITAIPSAVAEDWFFFIGVSRVRRDK
jgi:hypothetical protein